MSDLILTEKKNRTQIIRINRPSHRNALTHGMYDALAQGLEEAQRDDDIRCVLLTASAECFTAGNDLSDFSAGLPEDFRSTAVGRFLLGLADAAKPVVAAVNCPAMGNGTTMLLHCDLVFAGNNTAFQMPFASLGLCPEGGSSLLLPSWIGRVRTAELLMLGLELKPLLVPGEGNAQDGNGKDHDDRDEGNEGHGHGPSLGISALLCNADGFAPVAPGDARRARSGGTSPFEGRGPRGRLLRP